MNIASFIAQLDKTNGLARTNLFQVQIATQSLLNNAPSDSKSWLTDFVGGNISSISQRFSLMCTAAALPGYQFTTDQQQMYGPKFSFPVLPQYSDVVLSFFVGQDMLEKYFFDAWMYLIMEPTTNDFNYISEFATTIDIIQSDPYDGDAYKTTLVDAWPVSVAAMRLDWASNNQIHKLDVTFTYKRTEPYITATGDTTSQVSKARTQNQTTFDQTVGSSSSSSSSSPSTGSGGEGDFGGQS